MTLFAVRTSGSGRSVNGPLTEAYTKKIEIMPGILPPTSTGSVCNSVIQLVCEHGHHFILSSTEHLLSVHAHHVPLSATLSQDRVHVEQFTGY